MQNNAGEVVKPPRGKLILTGPASRWRPRPPPARSSPLLRCSRGIFDANLRKRAPARPDRYLIPTIIRSPRTGDDRGAISSADTPLRFIIQNVARKILFLSTRSRCARPARGTKERTSDSGRGFARDYRCSRWDFRHLRPAMIARILYSATDIVRAI